MESPLFSIEVRWFLRLAPDDAQPLREWIERADGFSRSPPSTLWSRDRTDVYLLVPGAEDIGLKWREQQLQFKGRCEQRGVHAFSGTASGMVERWARWSYSGAEIDAAFASPFTSGDPRPAKVKVPKKRALRKFAIDEAGKSAEVDPRTQAARVVTLEVTQIDASDGDPYWSVAVEASPDDSAMSAAFTNVAERYLQSLARPLLAPDASKSYPEWLASSAHRSSLAGRAAAMPA